MDIRTAHLASLVVLLLIIAATAATADREQHSKPYTVKAGALTLTISPEGRITNLTLKGKWNKRIQAETRLDSCAMKVTSTRSLKGGGVEFVKAFASGAGSLHGTVIERFLPDGDTFRWEIVVEGGELPGSTGISTIMRFVDTTNARFWTTWGSPGHLTPADWGGEGIEWHNPFETPPFRDMHLVYGGHFGKGAGYSIPVFSIMNAKDKSGIALAMSPEDPLLEVHMITSKSGEVTQTRRFNRLESGKPVSFSMHLFVHEPDWRSVIGYMVESHPRFFMPPLTSALDICGLGAYSSFEGEIDVKKYQAMGGVVNWKASFDFSYMGMFIPPVATDTTRWKRFDVTSEGEAIPGKATYCTIEQLRGYGRRMKSLGFSTLNYFNVTEFGGSSEFSPKVVYPRPELRPEEHTWTNPSAFLYDRFPGALLFGSLDHVGWHIRTPQEQMNSPVRFHDEPYPTWGGAIATDVGDPAYAEFLLDQARLHIEKIPDAQGICIDRLDWLNDYNWHADDGKSWIEGRPVRSLLNSFKGFIPRLSALMHGSGKAMFCNPHMNRLEMMEHFDGVYNEFGHIGHNLNLSAFLCLFKPLLCWTPDKATVMRSPDEYFQHHVLMGAFPTAPFPGNDHTLQPDPEVERFYLDYGKMFTLLRGRQWVLLPHVIEVEKGTALANVFLSGKNEVLVPVMMGKEENVQVVLGRCKQLLGSTAVSIETYYPGEGEAVRTSGKVERDALILPVHLKRGCALVRVVRG
jgi:hypothetical protein